MHAENIYAIQKLITHLDHKWSSISYITQEKFKRDHNSYPILLTLTLNNDYSSLNLSEDDVEVSYTRYINHMKSTQNPKSNEKTIDEAVKAELTPGNKRKINEQNLNLI